MLAQGPVCAKLGLIVPLRNFSNSGDDIVGTLARLSPVPAATPGSEEDRSSPCGGCDDERASSPPALAATVGFEEDRSSPCGG